MKDYELKYGCNPNQKPAKIYMENGCELPIEILNGRPGYINLLDAMNSWQLVKEIKDALGMCAATSFKHVSPTSAAVGIPMTEKQKKAFFVDDIEGIDESAIATAYARARGTDRMSSFGDWIALSDKCDVTCAKLIGREVSDGIIAPDYDEEALEILKAKRKGNYNIIDKNLLTDIVTENKELPEEAKRDLVIALITLKYTQSNSVCYAENGQTIGVGAGQQSRIHCTRLAGEKADKWHLRQHDKVLNLPFKDEIKRPDRDNAIDVYLSEDFEDVIGDGNWQQLFTEKPQEFPRAEQREYLAGLKGVCLGSDAFFPFGDNIERAAKSGVSYIAQPGGSIRDDNVIETCNKYNMVMAMTGIRLFHH